MCFVLFVMGKKGVSAVVATVLVILITIAGVSIIWVGVLPMLQGSFENVCLDADVSVVGTEGYTCYDSGNDIFGVQVAKGSNDVNVSGLEIILSAGGDSMTISERVSLDSNSKKIFYFPVNIEPESVGVAPVVMSGRREKVCDESSSVKLSGCKLSPKINLHLTVQDSLINSDSWTVGEGDVGGYDANGNSAENVREWGIGPHGDRVLLWVAVPDDVNNADGGWDYNNKIPIDHTKAYRSTVWIKKTGSTDGNTYFGCSQSNTSNLDGSDNSNPYFRSLDLPELGKWYLFVGYIHGSGDPSMTSYGGIYDGETGEKVLSMTDYKNKLGATVQDHRTYLYYDVTVTDRQYFWNPTFTEVSDYELPIEIA
jgi:FlaG/FlaF family flagellin (archaellin)